MDMRTRDKMRKGNVLFTDDEIRSIKNLARGGMTVRELAKMWVCGFETIRKIIREETYQWVGFEDGMQEGAEIAATMPNAELDRRADESLRKLMKANLVMPDPDNPPIPASSGVLDKLAQGVRELGQADQEVEKLLNGDEQS